MNQITRQTIEKKANKNGVVFALITDGNTFEVWKLCENYNSSVRGGMTKTWRYVELNMNEFDARKLFIRRAA